MGGMRHDVIKAGPCKLLQGTWGVGCPWGGRLARLSGTCYGEVCVQKEKRAGRSLHAWHMHLHGVLHASANHVNYTKLVPKRGTI